MRFVTKHLIYLTLFSVTIFEDKQKRNLDEDLVPSTRTLKPLKPIQGKIQLKNLSLTPKVNATPHQLVPINPNINLELLSVSGSK